MNIENESITLKDKCMLISVFNGLSYTYPEILEEHNISSPIQLIKKLFVGDERMSIKFRKFPSYILKDILNIEKIYPKYGPDGKKYGEDYNVGFIKMYILTSIYFNIFISIDKFVNSENITQKLLFGKKSQEILNVYKEEILKLTKNIPYKLENIILVSKNHAEFVPFPYVRNKHQQKLYEQYSKNFEKEKEKLRIDEIKKLRIDEIIKEQAMWYEYNERMIQKEKKQYEEMEKLKIREDELSPEELIRLRELEEIEKQDREMDELLILYQ